MNNKSPLHANWNYPTSIRFGAGRIAELPQACLELGMRRPLLVTDAALAELPMTQHALQLCTAAKLQCGLYSEVQGNPVDANVSGGVLHYQQGGHDGIIAFGGGSGLDAAKAIALMVGQDRPLWDFEDRDDWWTRANAEGIAPLVAVPTTAGTGSEVGRASVITDESDHTKKIIFHPKMLPAIVIADPELTVGLPAGVTAAVGMDALSHNLEAFCSPLYHPMADGIALEGMRLVKNWLTVAYAEGDNIEARSHMMVAASMGATAFQKGLGAMHSLSHPCGSVLGTHHGLTNGVVMPYVLEFNRPAIEGKMEILGRFLGLDKPSLDGVLDWIVALREDIGIPHRLADLGVTTDFVPRFARMAEADPPSATNPVTVDVANLSELYQRAIDGELTSTARA